MFSFSHLNIHFLNKTAQFSSPGDAKYVSNRKMGDVVTMRNEEAINMAKWPGGDKPEVYRAPIEREDWPAPPAPAAAYPHLSKS